MCSTFQIQETQKEMHFKRQLNQTVPTSFYMKTDWNTQETFALLVFCYIKSFIKKMFGICF